MKVMVRMRRLSLLNSYTDVSVSCRLYQPLPTSRRPFLMATAIFTFHSSFSDISSALNAVLCAWSNSSSRWLREAAVWKSGSSATRLHSSRTRHMTVITSACVSVEAKEKLLNCSGKLCSGMATTPKYGAGGAAGAGGS